MKPISADQLQEDTLGETLATPPPASQSSSSSTANLAAATISVDPITPDDIVNAAEAGGNINVTGTVGGDAADGDIVSFTIDGNNYSGTVGADNTFSISVSGAHLATQASFDATVTGEDAAGNPFTATTISNYGVDLTATASIIVDAIPPEVIAGAGEEEGENIIVTGTVGGDAAPGDTVSLTIGSAALQHYRSA